ncbi:metal homeostasis factor ATX1 [Aspergillus nomiae NRRL 13137]|uniref:Metal homeostasis factor ATX1 n=1 Tax=Aspergillus nomiae NRRL (strain ATCC 15546 / NRRL 13137 / CBS 260.88 / M93) TaxID=1509407 RepID=A0A0L1JGX4_ASPN3|nr:metal homeostasis factor ATX1 [Aspergillus nomiae NRRL 13137]KNG90653.1 metal homeostasis factor ATX1 [Aspergillus nomiae NRRL 13137]
MLSRTLSDHSAMDLSTGLKSLDISLEQQTVSIVAEPSLPYDAVLAAIKEKGKDVHSGEIDGVPHSI